MVAPYVAMAGYEATGHISWVVYTNEQNSFTVVWFIPKGSAEKVKLVGAMPAVVQGDEVSVKGEWERDGRFGMQVAVSSVEPVLPGSRDGVERYLSSGAIPGVGKKLAKSMVEFFGDELLEVLENTPERLREMPGIGKKKGRAIAEVWEERVASRRPLIALYSMGVGTALANRLMAQYGKLAVKVLETQPYRLAREVVGVGFLTADRLARGLGISKDSPERVEAAAHHYLDMQTMEGHCYLPEELLVQGLAAFLDVDEELVTRVLKGMYDLGTLILERDEEGTGVYLPLLHYCETHCAEGLLRLSRTQLDRTPDELERAIDFGLASTEVVLTDEQAAGVELVLRHPCSILTGGPGTGKTTVIRAVISGLRYLEAEVLLCSPTGRAAKRMTETTGVEAKTIHRLLEYNPVTGEFSRNEERPLQASAVVVDEVSMMDIQLTSALLAAIPDQCRLILVGDKDQLESVGPGAVLRDCIASGAIPAATLNRIHRQAESSAIIVNSHRILNGELPELEAGDTGTSDFFFVERDDPGACASTVVEMISRRIPSRFGMDPIRDIQVLTPMYRGELGAHNLNRLLQQQLNPHGRAFKKGEKVYRVGDRVMQVKNDYSKDVFNGDIGFVHSVSEDNLTVRLPEGRVVEYGSDDLDNLVLAYAVTVHKSQGSEYPCAVMVLHGQHYVMLRRNLLYTGVTRGKRLVVLAGSKRALQRAISNDVTMRRYSRLPQRLGGREFVL
jgi:exodeoxyribonuclease V alpha subunit